MQFQLYWWNYSYNLEKKERKNQFPKWTSELLLKPIYTITLECHQSRELWHKRDAEPNVIDITNLDVVVKTTLNSQLSSLR